MTETFNVANIKCSGCESSIVKRLSGLKGVSQVEVDSTDGKVSFCYEEITQKNEALHALSGMGYPLEDDKNRLIDQVKSYASCMIGRINNLS